MQAPPDHITPAQRARQLAQLLGVNAQPAIGAGPAVGAGQEEDEWSSGSTGGSWGGIGGYGREQGYSREDLRIYAKVQLGQQLTTQEQARLRELERGPLAGPAGDFFNALGTAIGGAWSYSGLNPAVREEARRLAEQGVDPLDAMRMATEAGAPNRPARPGAEPPQYGPPMPSATSEPSAPEPSAAVVGGPSGDWATDRWGEKMNARQVEIARAWVQGEPLPFGGNASWQEIPENIARTPRDADGRPIPGRIEYSNKPGDYVSLPPPDKSNGYSRAPITDTNGDLVYAPDNPNDPVLRIPGAVTPRGETERNTIGALSSGFSQVLYDQSTGRVRGEIPINSVNISNGYLMTVAEGTFSMVELPREIKTPGGGTAILRPNPKSESGYDIQQLTPDDPWQANGLKFVDGKLFGWDPETRKPTVLWKPPPEPKLTQDAKSGDWLAISQDENGTFTANVVKPGKRTLQWVADVNGNMIGFDPDTGQKVSELDLGKKPKRQPPIMIGGEPYDTEHYLNTGELRLVSGYQKPRGEPKEMRGGLLLPAGSSANILRYNEKTTLDPYTVERWGNGGLQGIVAKGGPGDVRNAIDRPEEYGSDWGYIPEQDRGRFYNGVQMYDRPSPVSDWAFQDPGYQQDPWESDFSYEYGQGQDVGVGGDVGVGDDYWRRDEEDPWSEQALADVPAQELQGASMNVPAVEHPGWGWEQARDYASEQAQSRGFDEDAQRALHAVLRTENAFSEPGIVGDQDLPGGGSHGALQFYRRFGEMPGYAAAQGVSEDEAAQRLNEEPYAAIGWALDNYLGDALREGQRRGLRGPDLATYIQRNGQRSVEPQRAGQNFQRLYGGGQDVGVGLEWRDDSWDEEPISGPYSALGSGEDYGVGAEVPPLPVESVVGTGHKFGDEVSMEGVHKGTDLQAVQGTPALAPVTGTVVEVKYEDEGLGLQVTVEAETGERHKLSHLSEAFVDEGDHVEAGEEIAAVGSTGKGSTGPHLDYRIMSQDESQFFNPEPSLGQLAQLPRADNGSEPGGMPPRPGMPPMQGMGQDQAAAWGVGQDVGVGEMVDAGDGWWYDDTMDAGDDNAWEYRGAPDPMDIYTDPDPFYGEPYDPAMDIGSPYNYGGYYSPGGGGYVDPYDPNQYVEQPRADAPGGGFQYPGYNGYGGSTDPNYDPNQGYVSPTYSYPTGPQAVAPGTAGPSTGGTGGGTTYVPNPNFPGYPTARDSGASSRTMSGGGGGAGGGGTRAGGGSEGTTYSSDYMAYLNQKEANETAYRNGQLSFAQMQEANEQAYRNQNLDQGWQQIELQRQTLENNYQLGLQRLEFDRVQHGDSQALQREQMALTTQYNQDRLALDEQQLDLTRETTTLNNQITREKMEMDRERFADDKVFRQEEMAFRREEMAQQVQMNALQMQIEQQRLAVQMQTAASEAAYRGEQIALGRETLSAEQVWRQAQIQMDQARLASEDTWRGVEAQFEQARLGLQEAALEGEMYNAELDFQARMADIQSRFEMHGDQMLFNRESLAAENEREALTRDLQREIATMQDARERELQIAEIEAEKAMQLLDIESRKELAAQQTESEKELQALDIAAQKEIHGTFLQRQAAEEKLSALKNPWVQQLTGMAPGFGQPGGPGGPQDAAWMGQEMGGAVTAAAGAPSPAAAAAPGEPAVTPEAAGPVATQPPPTYEEFVNMSPFERAALRVQSEVGGQPWEQAAHVLRNQWAEAGGPTEMRDMTALEAAGQGIRERIGTEQVAETMGQRADEYWEEQGKRWGLAAPAQVSQTV